MKQLPDGSDPGRTKFPVANTPKEVGSRFWGAISGSDAFQASNDASLFSSSLPVLPLEKLNLNVTENGFQTLGVSPGLDKFHQDVVGNNPLEDIETHTPHGLLPDDENELLAGIMDDFDLNGLPSSLEDLEDGDLFGSSGGMELESGLQDSLSMGLSKLSLSDAFLANGIPQYGLPNGVGAIAGEHPYGEHPSRTLFVRNINSNVEDSELRALFEQYGDIRTLYTACKHRGFVMISYYDIRAARTAMRALQNKPLRRRKLDIHFSIPKDNPSEKDINQGTLVVFNLDPSVSNEDLRQIFGAYGEVKEIRETPHKRHHKFIEYYDVRAADAALKSLNRSDIAGKRIKLEPSRPGGARRNLMLQLNQEVEQDESRGFRHQVDSPIASSPPGNWLQFHSPVEHNLMHTISNSPGFRGMSPASGNHISGLTSIMNSQPSNFKIAPIGKDQGRGSLVEHAFTNSNSIHEAPNQQAHSLPSFGQSSSNGSGVETLSGPQFLWGSPNRYSQPANSSGWPTSSMDHPFASSGKSIGIPFSGRQGSLLNSSQLHNHHIGSAPSGVPLQRHFGFFPNSPDNNSFMNSVAFGGTSVGHNEGSFMMNMPARGSMNSGISIPRNVSENGSSNMRMMSSPSLSPVLLGNGPYSGLAPPGMEAIAERVRSRRIENNGNQADNKLLFQLDLDKIRSGEDTRTTLMIKNIPNKYTSKMLLAAIDENHRGTFDFLYLPIDFKNKCNVGYAFINMLSPSLIIPFYETFNGKKWEKFNSEKVASLAYARIQGKTALVTHFQNSSLMNEDKRCRPILFHPEGLDGGDQFIQDQMNPSLNIVRQPNGTSSANPLYISESDYAGEMPEAS